MPVPAQLLAGLPAASFRIREANRYWPVPASGVNVAEICVPVRRTIHASQGPPGRMMMTSASNPAGMLVFAHVIVKTVLVVPLEGDRVGVTFTVPCMLGCTVQWYAYEPDTKNRWVRFCPLPNVPV